MKFDLISNFKPTGDQPNAIQALINGLHEKVLQKENKFFLSISYAYFTGERELYFNMLGIKVEKEN